MSGHTSLFRRSHPVMLACPANGNCLRALIPFLLREDHFVADVEMFECRTEHPVFVKVNLPAIQGLDEAIAFFRKELADFRVRRPVMRLHIAAQAAYVVLQLPPHRLESVANRHIHILVWTFDFKTLVPPPLLFVFQRRLMRDDEFLTRHPEFDAYVKWVAASMVPMRCLHNHTAARDAAEILIELPASSWIRAATAADASMFRKVVCTGSIMIVWTSSRFEGIPLHCWLHGSVF